MPPDLKELEFPLLKYYVSPPFIKKIMDALRKYPSETHLQHMKQPDSDRRSHTEGMETILHITIIYDRDKNFLMLSDYFNQESRMKSTFLNSVSCWDYFDTKKKKIISEVGPRPDHEKIYGHLWGNTRMCSSFPIIVAKAIIDFFKPGRVFDPCAGWGDRMLACIAAGIPYTGVDPNVDLQKGYRHMIDFFDLDPGDYKVFPSPFEEIKGSILEEIGKFPLIFTSPPFFNMEGYGSENTQSNIKFPTYDKWRRGFLFPLIRGCLKLLEDDGKLVIYVNNIKGYPILDDTRGYLSAMKVRFLGKVFWKNSKYPKCVLVYQKN